jgi:hypothetical protein
MTIAVEQELRVFAPIVGALREDSDHAYMRMTTEQKQVFDYLLCGIHEFRKRCNFIEGMAGRGKSFLIHALCNRIRSEKKVVMIGGSTALSIRSYQRGRTLHNLFHISITEVRLHPSC